MDLWDYLMSAFKDLMAPTPKKIPTKEDLWVRLTIEKNYTLIAKLRQVEAKTPGYGTIIVPKEGYSENEVTHNMVLDWLKDHQTKTLNPSLEIHKLERSLYDKDYT